MRTSRIAVLFVSGCIVVAAGLVLLSGSRRGAEDPQVSLARGFFGTACAGCHEEGVRDCFTAEHFEGVGLREVYGQVPAHGSVELPDRMRGRLRLLFLEESRGTGFAPADVEQIPPR